MGYVFNLLNTALSGILGSHDASNKIMKPHWRLGSRNLVASPVGGALLSQCPATPPLFPGPQVHWAHLPELPLPTCPGESCAFSFKLSDSDVRKKRDGDDINKENSGKQDTLFICRVK